MRAFIRRTWAGSWVLCAILLLNGCATQTRALLEAAPTDLPRKAEIGATPFFPQERYQCGPAALAMTLAFSGVAIEPAALVPQVYVPQREGSLQPEMLAAGRRNGAVSMTIPPRLESLLQEVASGHPVLVLQNLSLPLFPLWHYAVVIGYDLDHAEVVLRSGTTERLQLPMTTFEHTWARSEHWGMVTLRPGDLPATPSRQEVVNALVAFEQSGSPDLALKAYTAAVQRWPQDLTLQLGQGNAAYSAGDRSIALAAFKRAAHDHPDSAAAFNNLATVLAELGDLKQARAAAETAVSLGGPLQGAAQTTLAEIRSAQPESER